MPGVRQPLIGHTRICHTCPVSSDPLTGALRAYRRAEAALDRRRAELADAIGEAVLVHDRRQSEVVKITGYTREHIRRICRDYVDREIGKRQPVAGEPDWSVPGE